MLRLFISLVLASFLQSPSYAKAQVEFDRKNPEHIERLKSNRDRLRKVDAYLEKHFLGFGSLKHAAYVTRLYKGNLLFFGPPGGAKTLFVSFFLNQEKMKYFRIQFHQGLSEHGLIGMQSLESLKNGDFVIKTEGTLGHFRLAHIDEIDKGNPAVIAALLSLLNERQIWTGGQQVDAEVQTIYSTSNMNLVEFYSLFFRRFEEQTALALINRFQIKGYVTNWLSKEDQMELDSKGSDWLEMPEGSPELSDADLEAIDWDFLEAAAKSLFKMERGFSELWAFFINDLRKSSRARYKQVNTANQLKYIPTVGDFSERLRQQALKMIVASAFVDFLLSPLADDEHIQDQFKHKIPLDYLSIWRSYVALTTVMPGETSLEFKPASNRFELVFPPSPEDFKDAREETMFRNIEFEQTEFRKHFESLIQKSSEAMSDIGKFQRASDLDEPFEERLRKARDCKR